MGRELPFALGSGDLPRARRIAATSLVWNAVCSVLAGLAFLVAWSASWASGPALADSAPGHGRGQRQQLLPGLPAGDLPLGLGLRAPGAGPMDPSGDGRPHALHGRFFGFAGLAVHAALQAVLVTGFAHALRAPSSRPVASSPRWPRELLVTGLPLFLAGYLQTVAVGFDRVILLQRRYRRHPRLLRAGGGGARRRWPSCPGAVSSYVYPRMSYALGAGDPDELPCVGWRSRAAAVSLARRRFPSLAAGWLMAPLAIARFFPQYAASIPAVRWSLLVRACSGACPRPTQVLGSLKAWRQPRDLSSASCSSARWTFPWLLVRDLRAPRGRRPRQRVGRRGHGGRVFCGSCRGARTPRNRGGHGMSGLRRALAGPALVRGQASVRFWSLVARLRLRAHGASVGRGLSVRGPLRLHCHRTASIRIGDHCRIQSGSRATPWAAPRMAIWVGPGGRLVLGHRVGLSNATIVCIQPCPSRTRPSSAAAARSSTPTFIPSMRASARSPRSPGRARRR